MMSIIRKTMIFEILRDQLVEWQTVQQLFTSSDRQNTVVNNKQTIDYESSACESDFIEDPDQTAVKDCESSEEKKLIEPKTKNKRARNAKFNFRIARDPSIINDVQALDIGTMSVICPFCNALFYEKETMICCHHGDLADVLLPKFVKSEREIPELFKSLYNGEHEFSAEFLENIRKLNGVFSFTSLGVAGKISRQEAIKANSTLGNSYLVKNWLE